MRPVEATNSQSLLQKSPPTRATTAKPGIQSWFRRDNQWLSSSSIVEGKRMKAIARLWRASLKRTYCVKCQCLGCLHGVPFSLIKLCNNIWPDIRSWPPFEETRRRRINLDVYCFYKMVELVQELVHDVRVCSEHDKDKNLRKKKT